MDVKTLRLLQETFKVEAEEHLEKISSTLIELENILKSGAGREQWKDFLETIFRETHSLKGAANSVDRSEIGRLCQAAENIFAMFRKEDLVFELDMFNTLYQVFDHVKLILLREENLPTEKDLTKTKELLDKLRAYANHEKTPEVDKKSPPPLQESIVELPRLKQKERKTIRVSPEKLNDILLQVEEMRSFSLKISHWIYDVKEINDNLQSSRKEWDNTSNPLHSLLKNLQTKMEGFSRVMEVEELAYEDILENTIEDLRTVLMQPVSSILYFFPNMVRELAQKEGKDVRLNIIGDLDIDRRILEEIKDPLIHIVRNSIDHGLEIPSERLVKGKSSHGTINISITPAQGNCVEILIKDDGRGIDIESVKKKAMELGSLSQSQLDQMTRDQILRLIFLSGISTQWNVTDVSGRGLGLAIVMEKVEGLGGNIELESTLGKGTSFRIILPTVTSTSRGILIKIGDLIFVIPTLHVEYVVSLKKEAIKSVENRASIFVNNLTIAVASLNEILGITNKSTEEKTFNKVIFVILNIGGQRLAFSVDEVLGEQDILVKPLGKHLIKVPNIAGATILGNGKVTAILNVPDLFKFSQDSSTSFLPPSSNIKVTEALEKSAVSNGTKKRVLVVEDSITSRLLLKTVLESAGYSVRVTVDGSEGMNAAQLEVFDLVISDIDMPRMNGIEMTKLIRADRHLTGLPVILVTSNDSKEVQERGLEAGADAYVVKSNFDQNKFLDLVRRFTSD